MNSRHQLLDHSNGEPTSNDDIATTSNAKVLFIGQWRVDVLARSLTNGSSSRRLSPRAIRALSVLAEANGEVINRGMLLDRVWPDVTVSDESVTQVIAELRRAFGDNRAKASVIETIDRRGYRLAAPVLSAVDVNRSPFDSEAHGVNLAAHQLCLEARMVLMRSGPGAVEQSEELAREAASVAPDFALAQAEYAIALVQRHLYRANGLAGLELGRQRAEAAVRLRPDLALSHAAMGFALGAVERWREAKAAFGRAIEQDRHDPDAHYLGARTLFAARDFRAAAVFAERAGQLCPDDFRALYLGARAAATFDKDRSRRIGEACLARVRTRLDSDPEEPRALNALGPLFAQLGEPASAMAALDAEAERDRPLEFYNAVALATLGETSRAIEALESVADQGWHHPAWLSAEPCLAVLAGHRRFQRLAHSLGAA